LDELRQKIRKFLNIPSAFRAKKGVIKVKGICPFCEAERDIEPVKTRELIKVRGEAIDVEAHYLKCAVCANTFEDPRSEHDPLDLAYR
jgi:hypothetical protein